MNTKIILAILGVAVVAAALVGVSAAQFAGAQNQNQTPYQTSPHCINAATGEHICTNNGTCTNAYCNSTCTGVNCTGTCTSQTCNQTHAGNCNNTGAHQNQYCNQNNNCYTAQNQNQYGVGMMERDSGYGRGCHR